jgi:hypothetical protein
MQQIQNPFHREVLVDGKLDMLYELDFPLDIYDMASL